MTKLAQANPQVIPKHTPNNTQTAPKPYGFWAMIYCAAANAAGAAAGAAAAASPAAAAAAAAADAAAADAADA